MPSPSSGADAARRTRREFLAATGTTVAGATAIAGCSSGPDGPEHRLSARNRGPSLAEAFRYEVPADAPFADADRALLDRTVADGEATTVGFRLPRSRENTFVEADDSYYRLEAERAGEVQAERWLLWFDLLDGNPPADATPIEEPPADLPALDRRAVERAITTLVGEFGPRDLADETPRSRGHLFVRRGADDSDLLPEPPFSHLRYDDGEETLYARVVVEEVSVDLRRWRHTAEPVARSAEAYERFVREEFLRTAFADDELPEGAQAVVSGVTSGVQQTEFPPLSDGFRTVLERLGLDDVSFEDPESTARLSEPAFFRYDGLAFEAQLELFR